MPGPAPLRRSATVPEEQTRSTHPARQSLTSWQSEGPAHWRTVDTTPTVLTLARRLHLDPSRDKGGVYRIRIPPAERLRDVHEFPVVSGEGRIGISVASLGESKSGITHHMPRPEAEKVQGATRILDDLFSGSELFCRSAAIPMNTYLQEPVLQYLFPQSITRIADVRKAARVPATGYTFAHLLTNVVTRQQTWTYSVFHVQAIVPDSGRIAHFYKESTYIVAIHYGYDHKGRQVWYPELELRIPISRLNKA
ncbi:hypothetical protein OH77DRAFT_1310884 [Trametes cingulata]|nr:hypothetical protein OH77DRAFT_1310884 [Trametes cingulata]